MSEYTIADVSYNRDGEMEQFLIFWEDGEPETRRATTENILLFDPEDALPFDGGLREFLRGDTGLKIRENPEIIVARNSDDYSYTLSIDGSAVETTPRQAESFLESLHDTIIEDDPSGLQQLHESILQDQVRRHVVNALYKTFTDIDRINVVGNGWLVDSFFLVDWNGKMYTANDDPTEGDYIRDGNTAVKKDRTYEFVRLRNAVGSDFDPINVSIDGESYTLTEREELFLAKVTWLLDREYYHPDESFWMYTNRWADTPTEEPNMDQFSL